MRAGSRERLNNDGPLGQAKEAAFYPREENGQIMLVYVR